jgi:hypothetical protein
VGFGIADLRILDFGLEMLTDKIPFRIEGANLMQVYLKALACAQAN